MSNWFGSNSLSTFCTDDSIMSFKIIKELTCRCFCTRFRRQWPNWCIEAVKDVLNGRYCQKLRLFPPDLYP